MGNWESVSGATGNVVIGGHHGLIHFLGYFSALLPTQTDQLRRLLSFVTAALHPGPKGEPFARKVRPRRKGLAGRGKSQGRRRWERQPCGSAELSLGDKGNVVARGHHDLIHFLGPF